MNYKKQKNILFSFYHTVGNNWNYKYAAHLMMIRQVEEGLHPDGIRWLFSILLNNWSNPPKKLKLSKNDVKFMINRARDLCPVLRLHIE